MTRNIRKNLIHISDALINEWIRRVQNNPDELSNYPFNKESRIHVNGIVACTAIMKNVIAWRYVPDDLNLILFIKKIIEKKEWTNRIIQNPDNILNKNIPIELKDDIILMVIALKQKPQLIQYLNYQCLDNNFIVEICNTDKTIIRFLDNKTQQYVLNNLNK